MRILIVDDNPGYYDPFKAEADRALPGVVIEYVEDGIKAEELLRASSLENPYTVMVLDEFMGGGAKNGSDLLRRLHESRLSYDLPVIFITAHYHELPGPKIASYGEAIRLFLEKSSGPGCPLLNAVLLVAEQSGDTMKFHPNELFGESFIAMVMREVSDHIMRAKHAGYVSLDQQNQIGSIIRAYFTSLRMRERWDGDEVLDLTVFLTQSLCGIFDIADDLTELIRRFLSIEEVLYSIPRYRDHFFHQLKVFLLGFCLLNQMNRAQMLAGTHLESDTGMKSWFLASAFHDVGYPIEKMQGWLDRFIGGVLVSPGLHDGVDAEPAARGEGLVPITCQWGALLGHGYHWLHLTRVIEQTARVHAASPEEAQAQLGAELSRLVTCVPDHGIYSSLILQNFLRARLDDEEVDAIATAVALHNTDVAKAVREITGRDLEFARDPLSFILAYCDIAQDWGRARLLSRGPRHDSPFGHNVFDNIANTLIDGDTVSVDLRYVREFSPREVSAWRKDVFSRYMQPTTQIWRMGAGRDVPRQFAIRYFHGETNGARLPLDALTF